MTNQELNTKFDKFLSDNNNKFIERVDYNALNQCFDLAIYWNEYLGFPKSIYSGLLNAYQIYTQWSNPSFEKKENDATFVPIKGDVIVWSASKPGTGGAGHVAVCTGVGDTNTFQAFSQNDPTGSPSVLKTYNYSYVLGVQRLKVTGATPPMDNNAHKAAIADRIVKAREGAGYDVAKMTEQQSIDFASRMMREMNRAVEYDKTVQVAVPNGDSNAIKFPEVVSKLKAQGGCKPEDLSKAKEEGRKLGVKQVDEAVHKLL